jgi:hypothetical protein
MNRLLAVTLALLATGCIDDSRQDKPTVATSMATRTKEEVTTTGWQFEGELLEIAQTYESYGRLAPTLH